MPGAAVTMGAGAAAQGTVTASMAAANVAATGIKTFVSAYRKFAPARGPSRLDPQARRDAHEAMGRRSERPERARHWGSRRRTASSSCFGGSAGGENRKRFSSVSCSAKSTVRSGCSPGGRMSERWSFARTLFAKKPV